MINALQRFFGKNELTADRCKKAIALLDCIIFQFYQGGIQSIGYVDVERTAELIKEELETLPYWLEAEINSAVNKCHPARLSSANESATAVGAAASFFGFIVTVKGGINCIAANSEPVFNAFLPSALMMTAFGLIAFFFGAFLMNSRIDGANENVKALMAIRDALRRYSDRAW